MLDKSVIEFEYKKNLEQSIIMYLAEVKNYDLKKAFDIYYNSQLAVFIAEGRYGIENLDYKYLVNDLIEYELSS